MSRWEERFPRLWAALERISVAVFASLLFWLFCAPIALAVALDSVVQNSLIVLVLTLLVALFC